MSIRELSDTYISSLCMELSLLINAGIVPCDGVLMLWEDEYDKNGKIVLQSLLDHLNDSKPLSAAFRETGYFPDYMVNLTQAGEKTGRLSEVLDALSSHYDRQSRLTLAIRNAVLYPAILLVMMAVVVLILVIQVLPVFSDVFGRLGGQMPPFAVQLMRFGGWLADSFVAIAVIIGIFALIALAAHLSMNFRSKLKRAFSNAFGGYGIFWKITVTRFISVMSLAASSGLAAEETVELAAAVSGGGGAADKKYMHCIEILRSGGTLADGMYRASIISARNSRVLAAGSRSGMTEAAMAEIAVRYERDTQDELDRIIGRIEPALIISSSLLVGVILLTVMLPLMSIMTTIG